jgi:Ras-related protein Rab-2A
MSSTTISSKSSSLVPQVSLFRSATNLTQFIGIGKSCMLKRLVDNAFKEEHDVTVGVEFGAYMIRVEDKVFRLQIWDTVGQESFRSITKIFYRGSHAVILGYSVAEKSTFD